MTAHSSTESLGYAEVEGNESSSSPSSSSLEASDEMDSTSVSVSAAASCLSAPASASASATGGTPQRKMRQRIPRDEWEQKRHIVTKLYQEDKKPLKEVMDILAKEHNFKATCVHLCPPRLNTILVITISYVAKQDCL